MSTSLFQQPLRIFFSPLISAAVEIAELTGSRQFRARKKDEVSSEIISGKYQFLLEKKIFFHNESTKQMTTIKNIRETFGQET